MSVWEIFVVGAGLSMDAFAVALCKGMNMRRFDARHAAIIARELGLSPRVLVAVQPTRGLDVGAVEYIHRRLIAQRDSGCAVLLISLELDEVMNVSDRILVMYGGRITAELDPGTATVQELGLHMGGSRREAAQ